jgi:phosphoribosylamine-glycine ligase
MNILFISADGSSVVLHPKIEQEGHQAIWWIEDEGCAEVGDGIVMKTSDPDAVASSADLIIVDDNTKRQAILADKYRGQGKAVWGGGRFVEKLEHDRGFGMDVYQEYGIPIPDTFEVRGLGDVKTVLKDFFDRTEKVVVKLDGEAMAGSSFSFIAKNREMCLEQVTHWEDDGLLGGGWSGILQRFVPGIEVSTEAWWNGEEWSTHNITLEEKKSLSGDLGPAVGCAFNTVARISSSSRLFKMVLEPLGPLLKKHGYVGQIDTNAIVDADGVPRALEFTPRLGYDATPTLAWGNNHGYANKILFVLGLGGDFEGFGYQGRVWAGVRISVPPYPASSSDDAVHQKLYKACRGVPVTVPAGVEADFWTWNVMRTERGLVACPPGMVGVAFGGGSDPREAGLAAYRVADKIRVPDKQYRALDGWKRSQDALKELLNMKLIRLNEALPR